MSTATQTRAVHARQSTAGSTVGANARALAPTPLPRSEPKPRTPLSLVPATKRSRRAGFAVFCFALLLAALVGVLVINVNVANSQYDIVSLRGQEQALSQQNEALTQELQNLQAPQNVAVKAAELGMVTPGTVASINLDTQKIAGKATAAEKGKLPSAHVPTPAVPEDQAKKQTVADTKSEAAEQQSNIAPEGKAVTDGASEAESKTQKKTDEASSEDLNGGTIPAPAQQGSGQ
ncbi:hypothetical protein [Arthrobacter sp. AOP36-C1-22]|uniref:hypothetical protein n=1 Tax=Arthrobacter sp. AOP36-C1-22 TaxID=3457683 RepID=UPI0040338D18